MNDLRTLIRLAVGLSLLFAVLGCKWEGTQKNQPSVVSGRVTDIRMGNVIRQTGLKRLGINIEGQTFYDSGQMLRNLIFKNPGFEGETWQTILHCVAVTASSCTDADIYASWPANFVQGATFEFIYGSAMGQTGTITASTAAVYGAKQGVTISFDQLGKTPAIDRKSVV